MTYLVHLIVLFAFYAVLAMSLNMVCGYAGYLSLAHGGYFAIGAYAYAIGRVAYGLGTVASVAIGLAVAIAMSLGLSLPAWRFRGDFFVLISLAVQALLFSLASNLYEPATPLGVGGNLTNGPFGIADVPQPGSQAQVAAVGSIIVSPGTIDAGQTAEIRWNSFNATHVSISPWVGEVAPSGSITVSPRHTTTYTLTLSNDSGGHGVASVTIYVNEAPNPISPITLPLVIAGATALVCFSVARRLLSAPWGHVLRAIRDDELVTRSHGKRVRLAKVQLFAISCSMAALVGAWYGAYITYVDPSLASLDQGILIITMLLIGGAGNLRGPLIGAAVLLLLPEVLRLVRVPDVHIGNMRLFIYGSLLVLLMHMRPQGLAGEYRLK